MDRSITLEWAQIDEVVMDVIQHPFVRLTEVSITLARLVRPEVRYLMYQTEG